MKIDSILTLKKQYKYSEKDIKNTKISKFNQNWNIILYNYMELIDANSYYNEWHGHKKHEL